MPNHFRIAVAGRDFLEDRIAGVLGKCLAAVRAIRKALHCRVAGRGVDEDDRGLADLAEPARVLVVHHCRAGEHGPHRVGIKSFTTFFPVDKIIADGMAPVHVSP